MSKSTYKIGLINDWATGSPAMIEQRNIIDIVFDEAYESGLIDKPIELVARDVVMHPLGTPGMVAAAYKDLVGENVLACIGPHVTGITQSIRGYIEREKVPIISYTATATFPGEYCFAMPNGTFGDEMGLQATLMKELGTQRLGVVTEANPIGDEYTRFLRIHAKHQELNIVGIEVLSGSEEEVEVIPRIEKLRDLGADTVIFIGFGARGDSVLRAVNTVIKRSKGWIPHKVTIAIFPRLSCDFGYFELNMEDWEGWIGVDQIDEANPISAIAMDKYEARHGKRPMQCYALISYDIANVLAHALAIAERKTPDGLKCAIESIRNLPAATGGAENYISFGPWDRRGFKGPDYMVRRTVRGGVNMLLDVARERGLA